MLYFSKNMVLQEHFTGSQTIWCAQCGIFYDRNFPCSPVQSEGFWGSCNSSLRDIFLYLWGVICNFKNGYVLTFYKEKRGYCITYNSDRYVAKNTTLSNLLPTCNHALRMIWLLLVGWSKGGLITFSILMVLICMWPRPVVASKCLGVEVISPYGCLKNASSCIPELLFALVGQMPANKSAESFGQEEKYASICRKSHFVM